MAHDAEVGLARIIQVEPAGGVVPLDPRPPYTTALPRGVLTLTRVSRVGPVGCWPIGNFFVIQKQSHPPLILLYAPDGARSFSRPSASYEAALTDK